MKRLKLIKALGACALALAAAVFGTVMHQTLINGFPFGVAASLLITLLAALNLRQNRVLGWIFFAALGVLVFYIGLDSHADKMIPANLSGYLWSYGSVTIAAFVAMFPKFKKG